MSCLVKPVAPACGEEAATWLRGMYVDSAKIELDALPIFNDCDFAAGESIYTHTRTHAHVHACTHGLTRTNKNTRKHA